eukprot:scaffold12150_cov97-Cylindrotheca_fusiformis.AAC.4
MISSTTTTSRGRHRRRVEASKSDSRDCESERLLIPLYYVTTTSFSNTKRDDVTNMVRFLQKNERARNSKLGYENPNFSRHRDHPSKHHHPIPNHVFCGTEKLIIISNT